MGGIGNIGGSNSVSAGSSYGLFVEHSLPRRSPSPLLGIRGDRLSLVSPNVGRRVKGHRAIVGKSLHCTIYVYHYFISFSFITYLHLLLQIFEVSN